MLTSKLNKIFLKKFGPEWYDLELETLSLEIGATLDEVTLLKLMALVSINNNADLVINDADYFLRTVEILNSNVPDPHHHDIPSSLEVAFALKELESILGEIPVTHMLNTVVTYILNHEGHGEAFSKTLALYSGLPFISNDKTRACKEYTAHMREVT